MGIPNRADFPSGDEGIALYRKAYNKFWRSTNLDTHRSYVRKAKQKQRANMTKEQKITQRIKWRNNKLAKLGVNRPRPERCEVCGSKDKICLDHCHANHKFRGWLCNGCNTALGHVKDNPHTLRKLAEYLEKVMGD